MLAASDYNGVVICTDKMLKRAMEEGVRVDYVMTVDCSPKIIPFYEGIETDAAAVFNSSIDPGVIEAFKGPEIYYYHSYYGDPGSVGSVSYAMQEMTGHTVLTSAGCCGNCAWILARFLKMKVIALVGMDLGWNIDFPPEKINYWDFYLQHHDENYIYGKLLRKERHPFFDEEYYTCYMFQGYIEAFEGLHTKIEKRDGKSRTINCTGGGMITFTESAHLKDFLKEFT